MLWDRSASFSCGRREASRVAAGAEAAKVSLNEGSPPCRDVVREPGDDNSVRLLSFTSQRIAYGVRVTNIDKH